MWKNNRIRRGGDGTSNPEVTREGIVWDCGTDDLKIITFVLPDHETWAYRIVRGETALIPEIHRRTAPYVGGRGGRDADIKKAMQTQKVYTGDVDEFIEGAFAEFVMGVSLDVIDHYFDLLNEPTENKQNHEKNEYTEKSLDIMQNGDPVKQIIDTFNSIHIGDEGTGRALVLSVGSQSILNSDGIQPAPSGESGKGKSHACQTVLHLIPDEFWIETSLSAKAPFYSDIKPGTIVFSDDATIGDDLESTIKRATTNFQKETTHTTVDANRKPIKLHIPPRIVWWLPSVDNTMDTQTINRQFGVAVDQTPETDEKVAEFQRKKSKTGEVKFPVTDDVLICREIFRVVKEQLLTVVIPFADEIGWNDTRNRRNQPMFLDMVKSFAVMRFMQRKKRDENTIIATKEDFEDARKLYHSRAETQTTKLTDLELDIVRFIYDNGETDIKAMQTGLNLPHYRAYQLLHGQKGSGGILGKVPGLRCEKVSTDDGGRSVHKNVYEMVDFDLLGSYVDVVHLKGNRTPIDDRDKPEPPNDTPPAPDSDIPTKQMMNDAHTWWFDYTKEHSASNYNPREYLKFLTEKEPKYNTEKRRNALLWLLTHKRECAEGWM